MPLSLQAAAISNSGLGVLYLQLHVLAKLRGKGGNRNLAVSVLSQLGGAIAFKNQKHSPSVHVCLACGKKWTVDFGHSMVWFQGYCCSTHPIIEFDVTQMLNKLFKNNPSELNHYTPK